MSKQVEFCLLGVIRRPAGISSSAPALGGSGSGGPAMTRERPIQSRETASPQVLPVRSRPLEQAGAGGARWAGSQGRGGLRGGARVQVQPCCGARAQRRKNTLEDWSSVPALPLTSASCRAPFLFHAHGLH